MQEKTLQEVLKENQEKQRKIYNERKAKLKKEQLKEKILFSVIAIFIIAVTVALIGSLNEKDYQNCINSGNSVNFCESGL